MIHYIGLAAALLLFPSSAAKIDRDLDRWQAAFRQEGIASWYSIKTNGGKVTASGIPLSDMKMTAAHKTLPFGSVVRVTNMSTKRQVVVVITDRGPYKKGRIIDLSVAAAKSLGFHRKGLQKVKIRRVK